MGQWLVSWIDVQTLALQCLAWMKAVCAAGVGAITMQLWVRGWVLFTVGALQSSAWMNSYNICSIIWPRGNRLAERPCLLHSFDILPASNSFNPDERFWMAQLIKSKMKHGANLCPKVVTALRYLASKSRPVNEICTAIFSVKEQSRP